MGKIIIQCDNESLTRNRSNAFLRLKTLMEQTYEDEKEKYNTLKTAMTLYLSSLNSYMKVTQSVAGKASVQKVPLRTYFDAKHPGADIIETIIGSIDPTALVKSETYYEFSSELDYAASDDLIIRGGKNQRYTLTLGRPHRLNRVLR